MVHFYLIVFQRHSLKTHLLFSILKLRACSGQTDNYRKTYFCRTNCVTRIIRSIEITGFHYMLTILNFWSMTFACHFLPAASSSCPPSLATHLSGYISCIFGYTNCQLLREQMPPPCH